MSVVFRAADDTGHQEASARHELKFALPETDLGRIRAVLRTNARHVSHHQRCSVVRSIYFDDERLRGYFDSVEGAGHRRKVRLRWYDERDRRLFFEVKRRSFDIVLKERAAIESRASWKDIRYRDLVQRLSPELSVPHRELLKIQSRPVLLGEYRHEYFEWIDRSVRVTVDSELQWFSQLGKERFSRRFGIDLPRLVVLEVKTKPAAEVDVDELLYPLRLQPTRSSKYVVGCQRLGLVADTRGSLI